MSTVMKYLKNAVWVLIFLQIAPPMIKAVSKYVYGIIEPHNKVGVINLKDTIVSSKSMTQDLEKFFKDSAITAVILKIECCGGYPGSSQAIAYEIQRLKQKHPKPVIAYVENMCFSGAYYIAAAVDHIIVTPSALVGSIGVKFSTQFKLKQLLEQHHVTTHSISTGAYKNSTDMFTPLTSEQEALLQSVSDDCYKQFVADVAQYRHLNVEQSSIWADGKIFTGIQARGLRIVDEVGTFNDCIEYLKKQVLHGDRPFKMIYAKSKSAIMKWFNPAEDDEDEDFLGAQISSKVATGIVDQLQMAVSKIVS